MELKKILARCPELAATARHVRDFAAMMRDLRGDQIEDWMHRVQDDDLPALHSFVIGITRDHDAVVNGLTMSWSSGAVEGAVTRNAEAADVRTRQTRPAPSPHSPRHISKVTQRHPFTLPVPEPNSVSVHSTMYWRRTQLPSIPPTTIAPPSITVEDKPTESSWPSLTGSSHHRGLTQPPHPPETGPRTSRRLHYRAGAPHRASGTKATPAAPRPGQPCRRGYAKPARIRIAGPRRRPTSYPLALWRISGLSDVFDCPTNAKLIHILSQTAGSVGIQD